MKVTSRQVIRCHSKYSVEVVTVDGDLFIHKNIEMTLRQAQKMVAAIAKNDGSVNLDHWTCQRRAKLRGQKLQKNTFWQTKARGTNEQEYEIYLACADDGNGLDVTNPGNPLKTYQQWLAA